MKNNKERGFALTDAIIAIIIIMILTSVIIIISYNIYLQSSFIKRNTKATNIIVNLFEYAKSLDFDDINYNDLSDYYDNNNEVIVEEDVTLPAGRGYTLNIAVEDSSNNNQLDEYSKKITATVRYKLAKKEKKVEMSTIINKH